MAVSFVPSQLKSIVNLGKTKHSIILKELSKAEFFIFPSLLETVGLGLIEAASSECKILAADLPYVREVVTPSLFFNPNSPEDIAKAVKKALKGGHPNPKILLPNRIEEFVNLLTK